MGTSEVKFDNHAIAVSFIKDSLHLVLADGREISAPLQWFPRLLNASNGQRQNWRLIGNGLGIHWPEIDEDISVNYLITGKE